MPKCVHQSCGKEFDESKDADQDCVYHPGPPIFHEGQKGWKCCKPRFLTFDEFLTIPPCTTGKHSLTDLPPTIEKKAVVDDDTPITKPIATTANSNDPPPRAPITAANPTPAAATPVPESEDDDDSLTIAVGATCRRKTCEGTYKGGARPAEEQCVFHPGVPLFHEGSKGYTCCKRRVLEFEQFLRIEGCETKPRHLFIGSGKKKGGKGAGSGVAKAAGDETTAGQEVLDTVRSDFYQTGTTVIASFFLKKIDASTAVVEFQERELKLDLTTTDAVPKRYRATIPLFAPIDPAASVSKIMGTKLEITFAKADGAAWPVLRSDEQLTGEIFQVGRAGRAI